jgi:L-2-hydroxyglutarate oxidase LhgO
MPLIIAFAPIGGSSVATGDVVKMANDELNNIQGKQGGNKVEVDDMLVGGSGANKIVQGETVEIETVTARYVINCAGGFSDKIAKMVGDDSFEIQPRLGDYLLLNRNQVSEIHADGRHVFSPCLPTGEYSILVFSHSCHLRFLLLLI